MNKYKTISSILLVGIIFYLFIESFYNILININAYIFMNFSEILSLFPTLIMLISLIIIEYLFFMLAKISKKYKPYILIYIIVGIRISSQFVVIPNIIIILNFLMLFTVLIFFLGFIPLIEEEELFIDFSQFFGGIVIGLSIQFLFLIINISSNLTSDTNKLVPTFILAIILIIINNSLFYPKRFANVVSAIKKNEINSDKKDISLLHFVILGTLFIFSMMWIFNPMALSAYDIINLSINGLISNSLVIWPTYGFTYYIALIILTAIGSYVVIFKYLFSLNQKLLRIIVIFSIAITCILTILSIFIIENDFTIISSVYTSLLTIIGVFSIILYISYLFNVYTFSNPRKLLYGVIIFFLTNIIFIILHVEILWYEYLSLIAHLMIQIIIGSVLIFIYELKNLKLTFSLKKRSYVLNKSIIAILVSILILQGISIFVISQSRKINHEQNPNPLFMVWNIHNAIGDDDIFDLDRLVRDIKENDPDIIGLNEVDLGALKTSFVDLPSFIGHKLNMYYYYGFTFYKHYGDVILSKYPILEAEIITLPLAIETERPRAIIKAKIQMSYSDWTVIISHLSTNPDDRLVQVPFIVNEIEKEATFEKIVWMGDFNFEPTSSEYVLINGTSILNFTDTYRYLNTFPGYTGHFDDNHIPQKRIDYIMCSPDLFPKSSYVFCSISSDHCAVITQF
ncbi:MAG: endonuclease/exonuclease/phosphatase family protein [Candidatus Heimdallarchaeota archaeon]